VTSTFNATAASDAPESLSLMRTSAVLRSILTNNPGVQTFSVERILEAIGTDRVEATLTMFSIPAIVPVPLPQGVVAMPTGMIACQMMAGRKRIKLPQAILRKYVSRRALAIAIHAAVPLLEAAEKVVRPRWSWVTHPTSRRVIGLFVFLLAVAIGFPFLGFDALHATSIIAISLGLAEKDGLAVVLGVVAGLLSLVIVAATGVSTRALRYKVGKWLRKISRKLGINAFANFLERLGYKWLARILSLEWSQLLLLWDPEKRAAGTARRARPMTGAGIADTQARIAELAAYRRRRRSTIRAARAASAAAR
jgi:hypothetical protein